MTIKRCFPFLILGRCDFSGCAHSLLACDGVVFLEGEGRGGGLRFQCMSSSRLARCPAQSHGKNLRK